MTRWEAAMALLLASPPGFQTPSRTARMLAAWVRWRRHPVGALVAAAAWHPERAAIVDDEGSLTFAEFEARSNAVARAWREREIGPGTTVGLLCRDSRLFFDSSVAAQKLGADLVYVNVAFSPPQVAGVVEDEGIDALVYDDSLADAASEANPRIVVTEDELRAAAAGGDPRPVSPPARAGRVVVLTSGTTGRPKGAVRAGRPNALQGAALVASLPVMAGDTTVVAAPLFHAFGLLGANLALALSSTVVVRRRFDPETVLADVARHRARVLIAVPIMLQRLLAIPPGTIDRYDLSSLRVVLCGGAALSGELASRFMDRFGDVLYNVYGSSEAAMATVAGPRDLRRAPGTTGRPALGVVVRIADQRGRPLPAGVSGRVLVGSGMRMDQYSGGGGKDVVNGLVVTGDLGHFDRWGRLYIDGREDDMIVSGGENVFPGEVEEVLTTHPGVEEAAVVGVQDVEFGQRLKAFVVRAHGSAVTEDELKSYAHDRLARFKTPREIVFVAALPRTGTGKVLKRELATR